MLKLNPDCHNYESYKEQGRCPLVSVCTEDCVFVWKNTYEKWQNGDFEKVMKVEYLEF